jgi:hypothetical protein
LNLIARNSGGLQVVGRPQARPAWYPPDRVRPVRVQVWWRYAGEVAAAARLIGVFAPGQTVAVPLNPMVDRNLIFSTVSISSDGLRSARELADAHEQTLVYVREREAPTLTQIGPAGHGQVRFMIEGYTRFAIKRRITIAADVSMLALLDVIETQIDPVDPGARVVYLNRTDQDTGTRSIFVTVAHSSGGAYGADSLPLALTFADDQVQGGSTGNGDTTPHREYNLPGSI